MSDDPRIPPEPKPLPTPEELRAAIAYTIQQAEPNGITFMVLLADLQALDPMVGRKAVNLEIERLILSGEVYATKSKDEAPRYRKGPKPAEKERETLTTNDVLSETDEEGRDIRFWLKAATPGGKDRPILLLMGNDFGPVVRQSLLHLRDRNYYCSPAREIVKLNKDVFKTDAAGKKILQMKESIGIPLSYFEKQLGHLFQAYKLVPRDPARGPGPDDVEYVGFSAPPFNDWAKILLEVGQYPELKFLQSIAEFRFYTEGGTLVHEVGYNEAAEALYLPREEELPIDVRPGLDEDGQRLHAQTLASEVMELFAQFPFESSADISAYLALILTATMRPALSAAPLFGIDATTRGSGKTILAQMATHIATGGPPATLPWRSNTEEQEKTLSSALLTTAPALLFDNLPIGSPLGGAFLDVVLTSDRVDVRKLGGQVVPNVSTRKTFIATGNGLTFATDMFRRALTIRLTSKMENPENRKDLKIPQLEDYVREHAREINAKILGVCEAFRLAGRPDMTTKLGLDPFQSFHGAWTKYVRNCVLWLDLPDPCETRKRIATKDEQATFRTALYSYLLSVAEKIPEGVPAAKIAELKQFANIFPEEYVDSRTGKPDRRLDKGLKALAGEDSKLGRVGTVDGVEYTLKMRTRINVAYFYVERVEA